MTVRSLQEGPTGERLAVIESMVKSLVSEVGAIKTSVASLTAKDEAIDKGWRDAVLSVTNKFTEELTKRDMERVAEAKKRDDDFKTELRARDAALEEVVRVAMHRIAAAAALRGGLKFFYFLAGPIALWLWSKAVNIPSVRALFGVGP